MNIVPYLLDLVKLVIAGLVVFFTIWLFIKSYLDRLYDNKSIELKKITIEKTLQFRLQAYERIILFLERINPESMLIRLHISGMSADDLQRGILSEIRSEYQHNITQQLYVSSNSWLILRKLKDDTILMVNNATKSLPPNSSGIELSKAILNFIAQNENDNPYDLALGVIKQDIQQLF